MGHKTHKEKTRGQISTPVWGAAHPRCVDPIPFDPVYLLYLLVRYGWDALVAYLRKWWASRNVLYAAVPTPLVLALGKERAQRAWDEARRRR